MKAFLSSPRLAIAAGLFLAIGETIRRWGAWPFLPFLFDDYIAGAFLVYGAVRSLRDRREGQRFLAAAWALATGMGYMSFFGHLERLSDPYPADRASMLPHGVVTAIIGVLCATAVAALIANLKPVEPTMSNEASAPRVENAADV